MLWTVNGYPLTVRGKGGKTTHTHTQSLFIVLSHIHFISIQKQHNTTLFIIIIINCILSQSFQCTMSFYSSQIIKINVSGKIFITTRQTLLNHPNSLFYQIANRQSVVLSDDTPFFDKSPKVFEVILDWMRYNCLPNTTTLPFPYEELKQDAQFYRLHNLVAELLRREKNGDLDKQTEAFQLCKLSEQTTVAANTVFPKGTTILFPSHPQNTFNANPTSSPFAASFQTRTNSSSINNVTGSFGSSASNGASSFNFFQPAQFFGGVKTNASLTSRPEVFQFHSSTNSRGLAQEETQHTKEPLFRTEDKNNDKGTESKQKGKHVRCLFPNTTPTSPSTFPLDSNNNNNSDRYTFTNASGIGPHVPIAFGGAALEANQEKNLAQSSDVAFKQIPPLVRTISRSLDSANVNKSPVTPPSSPILREEYYYQESLTSDDSGISDISDVSNESESEDESPVV
eukprot:TRINITY_DN2613_c0_g2_i7.p1 TRINITY_DN2613_c0_g2~~TRINITY_DN2613_c0_g2_i7.p1  ORF type:complete len:455 (-),score=103.44 TRINITY_DN2613_c0_g2_i7:167-1531(-)